MTKWLKDKKWLISNRYLGHADLTVHPGPVLTTARCVQFLPFEFNGVLVYNS